MRDEHGQGSRTAKNVPRDRLFGLLLLLLLGLVILVRWRLLGVPLERDEGEYAYIGQLILDGIPPYRDAFTMKLPGVHSAYALLIGVFGATHVGLHVGLLLINLSTAALVFQIGRRLLGLCGAVMAAASFALISLLPSVQGVQANAEHFVILFACAGLLALLHGLEKRSLAWLALAGVLIGFGTVMKQHGVAFVGLAVCYLIYATCRDSHAAPGQAAWRIAAFSSGFLLVGAGLLLVLYSADVLSDFWFWTVDYALTYVSPRPAAAIDTLTLHGLAILRDAPLLWVMAALGLLATLAGRLRSETCVLLWLAILFSGLSIVPGFYFRPHYFLLIVPAAALCAGAGFQVLRDLSLRFAGHSLFRQAPVILALLGLLQVAYLHKEYFFVMSPRQVSRAVYGLNPFPEALAVAAYLREQSRPDEVIAVLGSEPQIYFYASRRAASGYLYMYPLTEDQPYSGQMEANLIKVVDQKNPAYIVFVNVPLSWQGSQIADRSVLKRFRDLVRRNYPERVALVEFDMTGSAYHWGAESDREPVTDNWIGVYRKSP